MTLALVGLAALAALCGGLGGLLHVRRDSQQAAAMAHGALAGLTGAMAVAPATGPILQLVAGGTAAMAAAWLTRALRNRGPAPDLALALVIGLGLGLAALLRDKVPPGAVERLILGAPGRLDATAALPLLLLAGLALPLLARLSARQRHAVFLGIGVAPWVAALFSIVTALTASAGLSVFGLIMTVGLVALPALIGQAVAPALAGRVWLEAGIGVALVGAGVALSASALAWPLVPAMLLAGAVGLVLLILRGAR